MEPEHLASLTPEERADLRLWHGRVNLLDRVKAMRGYAVLTLGAIGLGIAGFVAGVEEIPPLVLAPIVPLFMSAKLWRRGKSLRQSGVRLRRVLLMPRARQALRTPAPRARGEHQLEKLAPREVLDGEYGTTIRRAVDDRAAILDIAAKLSKEDRSQLKELAPTANALVERVARLAQAVYRLDQSIDPALADDIAARISAVQNEGASPEGERQLALLRRQRLTLDDLLQHRVTLARQLDNAALALANLRLDLIKLRSSGLQSALSDVSMATQEARALSRDISAVLEAAAELEQL
jgi:serine/threonine-protein kinase